MSSLGSILSTARTALFAQQTAIATTSHNIANAQSEGYSRQRVAITAGVPQRLPFGTVGTGVRVNDVERVRDQLLDGNYRRETGKASSYTLQSGILQQIEDVFGEPSETGLDAALDRFWSAWGDLANTPTSSSARVMVQQRGQQVVDALNLADRRLGETETSLRQRLSNSVSELGQLAKQVAEVNVQIVSAEADGRTAGDLRDTRDRLIDRLAVLGNVSVTEHANGGVAVTMGGVTIVDGGTARPIQTPTLSGGVWSIADSSGTRLQLGSDAGELGGMLHLLNTEIPNVRSEMDALARQLVQTVNASHRQGWSQVGEAQGLGAPNWDPTTPPTGSNINFFNEPVDPTQITARTIALSTEVRGNAQVIAAGYTQGSTSDNQLALDLGALRDNQTTMDGGTTSFNGYYRNTVSNLGLRVSQAQSSSEVFSTLQSQADVRRMGVAGVSVDEELTKLIQFQQAYTAAARLITAVDEMMETLLRV